MAKTASSPSKTSMLVLATTSSEETMLPTSSKAKKAMTYSTAVIKMIGLMEDRVMTPSLEEVAQTPSYSPEEKTPSKISRSPMAINS